MEENKILSGSEIKEARKRKGLSQTMLSKMTGISNSVLSRIEHEYAEPSEEQLAKILNALQDEPESSAKTAPEASEKKHRREKSDAGDANTEVQNADNKADKAESLSIESEESTFKGFSDGAPYCDSFKPENYLKRKMGTFNGLIINGHVVIGDEGPVYVPAMYLPIEAYRAWLRSVYPQYSIKEYPFEIVNGYGNDAYVTVKVQVSRWPGDEAPFAAQGMAKVGRKSIESLIRFAGADALKRAMVNQGFGDGLNWEVIKHQLPTYVGVDVDQYGNTCAFNEYTGPLYCNGQLIRKAQEDEESRKKALIVGGNVESIAQSIEEKDVAEGIEAIEKYLLVEDNPSSERRCDIVKEAILAHNRSIEEEEEEEE